MYGRIDVLECLGLLLLGSIEWLAADESTKVEPKDNEEGSKHGVHEVVIPEEDRGQGDARSSDLMKKRETSIEMGACDHHHTLTLLLSVNVIANQIFILWSLSPESVDPKPILEHKDRYSCLLPFSRFVDSFQLNVE